MAILGSKLSSLVIALFFSLLLIDNLLWFTISIVSWFVVLEVITKIFEQKQADSQVVSNEDVSDKQLEALLKEENEAAVRKGGKHWIGQIGKNY